VSFKIVTEGYAHMLVIWGIVRWRVLNLLRRFVGTTAWTYIIYYKNENFFGKTYYTTQCKSGNDQHVIILVVVLAGVVLV